MRLGRLRESFHLFEKSGERIFVAPDEVVRHGLAQFHHILHPLIFLYVFPHFPE